MGFVVLDLLFSVQCFVENFLSFFCWPLCCLSFDLWLLITTLVSSNFSYHVFLFLAGRSLNDYNYFPFYVKVFIAKRGLKEEFEDKMARGKRTKGQTTIYKAYT